MRRNTLLWTPLAAGALLLGTAGCEQSTLSPHPDTVAPDHSMHAQQGSLGTRSVHAQGDLLKSVRQATSRFNSTKQALRAGYAPDDHCAAHPVLGGMGYHWVNGLLIDPVFDPMQPEVVIYAEGPGGNLRLVAIEYVVIDVGQDHPEFDGYPLDVGGVPPLTAEGIPHWSLHVWLHEHNPNGIFTPFNPNVVCS
jgi:hypothetical protein